MDTRICDAIRTLAVLQLDYDGRLRIVEPHCHGTSRTGKEALRVYQIAGESKSGPGSGWRMLVVEKISGLHATGQRFAGPQPDYNPNDSDMISIHCRL